MAWAEKTWLARKSQWNHYHTFCSEYDITPLPCTVDTVCWYIAYMCRKFKYSSITSYVCGLVQLQKLHGLPPVSTSDFMVARTLRGARRKLGDTPSQSFPLAPSHLMLMYKCLDISKSSHLCWWAATITAFRGLLRKAHITVSDQAICVGDLDFRSWGLLLTLPKTKTIQYGERILEIPFTQVPGSIFCVSQFVHQLVIRMKLSETDNVFQYYQGGVKKPMSYHWYTTKLKELSTRIGLAGKVTSHSLRRGGATYLNSLGVTLVDIKQRGDWRSLAVLLYLSDSLETKVSKDKVVSAFMRFV